MPSTTELRETAARRRQLQQTDEGQQTPVTFVAVPFPDHSNSEQATVLPAWISLKDILVLAVIGLAYSLDIVGTDLGRILLALLAIRVGLQYRRRFDTVVRADGTIQRSRYQRPPPSPPGGGGGGGYSDFRQLNGNGTTVSYSACGGGGCGR